MTMLLKVKPVGYVGGKFKENLIFNKTTLLDAYICLTDICLLLAPVMGLQIQRLDLEIFPM